MTRSSKKGNEKTATSKVRLVSAGTSVKRRSSRTTRERVLVEFPLNLLERTDNAATQLQKNRSELIRTAVEQMLDRMEKKNFEAELAAAYAANAKMNLELAEEFSHIDTEGL